MDQPTYILDSVAAKAKLIGQQKIQPGQYQVKLALPKEFPMPKESNTILNMLDPVIRRFRITAIQRSLPTGGKKHYTTWFLACDLIEEIPADQSRLDRMRRRLKPQA
jgi:hypothetical protein